MIARHGTRPADGPSSDDAGGLASAGQSKISIRGLRKEFPAQGRRVVALENVDLDIASRQFVCLVGPSGCGKSTLLRILAGLETHTTGEVVLLHEDASKPLTSMVFQDQSIFPWMVVTDNVGYGLRARGVPAATRRAIVDEFVEKVGLKDFAHAYPHQLSGGMKQRVSVARAFANDPEVLLMDEPFGALDEQLKLVLQEELLSIWETHQKTVVFVTHGIEEALALGDRVVVFTSRPGRIKTIIDVPFPRPRDLTELRASAAFAELTHRIWLLLRDEVRQISGL